MNLPDAKPLNDISAEAAPAAINDAKAVDPIIFDLFIIIPFILELIIVKLTETLLSKKLYFFKDNFINITF